MKSFLIKSYRKKIKLIWTKAFRKGKRSNEKYYLNELESQSKIYRKRLKQIEENNKKEIHRLEKIYTGKCRKLESKTNDVILLKNLLNNKSDQLDNMIQVAKLADSVRVKVLQGVLKDVSNAILEENIIQKVVSEHDKFKKQNNVHNLRMAL